MSGRADSYWTRRRNIRALSTAIDHFENSIDAVQSNSGPLNGTGLECDVSEEVYMPVFAEENMSAHHLCDGYTNNISDDNSDDTSAVFLETELSNSFEFESGRSCSTVASDSHDEQIDLAESLQAWAVQYGISLTAVTALLKLINPFVTGLPLDARTLLRTPRSQH